MGTDIFNRSFACCYGMFVIALLFFESCACSCNNPLRYDLLEDLDEMLAWFPGEYDNDLQVTEQKQELVEKELMQRHTHHLFQPVKVNFTDSKTLYAQQYQHYDPEDIYRQRIYAFDIDKDEEAIRLTIYTPKDPPSIRDLHLNKKLQASLKASDFVLKPGCEVYWKREGDEYHGYLKKDACNYFSTRYNKQVYLNETLILMKDALLLHDKALDADGNSVFGSADKGPTINLKMD